MTNKYAHLAPSSTLKRKAIFQRVRGAAKICMHKTDFSTEEAATVRAAEITAEGVPMRCYKCPHCYSWHLARVKGTAP